MKPKTVNTCANCDYFAQSPWSRRKNPTEGLCDDPKMSCGDGVYAVNECLWNPCRWTPIGGRKRRKA